MLEVMETPQSADDCTTVPERIADWAVRQPAAIAMVHENENVTYKELQHRTANLADQLWQLDVQREQLVAVYLERSVDCVVAASAVLAAGAAYVMLDVRQPTAWNSRLLEDCGARLVITRPSLWESTVAMETVMPVDVDAAGAPSSAGAGPRRDPLTGNALAYVSYTSGSSGAPKGVMIEHAGLANLVDWYLDRHKLCPEDHLTQLARPSFDAFALEVWPCLSAGATLHIVDSELTTSPVDLRDWLCATGITVTFLPTPLAEPLLDLPWPPDDGSRLRDMLVGADRLYGHPPTSLPFRLHNNYGPTECTVLATCCEVSRNGARHDPPPIGTAIPGMTADVLDEQRRPIADDQPGELHLGGVGVARGYLGARDELQSPFWTDPFRDGPGARMYATGDLARRSADGQLHFMGRVDDQIKVRGFRVEPAEIESALLRHPAVRHAAIVAPQGVESQIVAYVVPRGESVDPATVRQFLESEVPDFMVPAAIVLVDELPVTDRGKLDRRALAERPFPRNVVTQPLESAVPDVDTAHVESVLAEIWSEILGLTAIDPHENFFDIGGDSLQIIKLIGKCRRRGVSLRPEDVYTYPVLRDLARALQESQPLDGGTVPTGMVSPQ